MTPAGIALTYSVPFVLLLIGLGLTVLTDSYMSRLHKKTMLLIVVLAATLIVQNAADYLLTGTPHILLRKISGIYGYSMRPAIIVLFYYFVDNGKKAIPAWCLVGLNAALYLTALFSPVTFTYGRNNYAFVRGPLGYTCHIVGANILGLYCCLCTDPAYAEELGITPPDGFLPKAAALNSGLYRLVRGEEDLLDSLAEAYFPAGGTEEEYDSIALRRRVTAAFPPTFVMTAPGDFLTGQAKPFYDHLRTLGVPAEYHCYGDEKDPLKHVFHIDIKLSEARKCNADECAFFSRMRDTQKGDLD